MRKPTEKKSAFHTRNKAPLLSLLVLSFLLGLTREMAAADAGLYVVYKRAEYWQTNTSAAILETGTPFTWYTLVLLTASNSVNSATVKPPGGSATTLYLMNDAGVMPGAWYFANGQGYASQSAMDAAYPNGAYSINISATHDGTKQLSESLTGNTYPTSPPHVSNYAAAQIINPAQSFTLQWDAYSGGSTNDVIYVRIVNADGLFVYESPFPQYANCLNGTNLNAIIPAGTLSASSQYTGEIRFYKVVQRDNTSYLGALGATAYERRTYFYLGTTAIPPSITMQPQSQTVAVGGIANFSVTASGGTPLSYQWRMNGIPIGGATATNYTVSNAQANNAGNYTVVVTNVAGAVTSSVAALMITIPLVPPSITAQPQSQAVAFGGTASFSVTASGTAPLSYQWRFSGAPIGGATATNCTVSNAQTNNAGSYTVVVTNIAGAVTSSVAVLSEYQAGSSNSLLSLNGGGYMTVSNAPELQNSTEITIEAWIWPANAGGTGVGAACWLSKGDGADCCSDRSYDWGFNGNQIDLAMFLGTTNVIDFAMPVPALSNWIHIAVAFSSQAGLYQVFTNGILAGARTVDENGVSLVGLLLRASSRTLTFGLNPYWYTTAASGYMDEIRIWKVARTAQEIQQSMNCRLTGLEPGLVACWNFDNGTAKALNSNYAGSLVGNASISLQAGGDVLHALCAPDVTSPTNTITAPVAGLRVSNAVCTVIGQTTDNVGVGYVYCMLNNSANWIMATTTNQWTNWTATVTLIPGTNVLTVESIDASGNISAYRTLSLQFVVTNRIQLASVGLGTVSPNYSNAWLEVGRNYSITSAPATGFVFTNWTVCTNWIGGVKVTGANLAFMMQSNLTLLTTFVETSRPTLTIVSPANNQHMTNALATITGANSDNWGISGVWYQLNSNAWNYVATTTNSYTNWTQIVMLRSGTNTVSAYAQNLGGNYSLTNTVSFVSSNTFALQLVFTNAVPLKTNGLAFILDVSIGLNGRIEVSTNLLNWTTLTNFVGSNSIIMFRDPGATNSTRRFYRAVIP